MMRKDSKNKPPMTDEEVTEVVPIEKALEEDKGRREGEKERRREGETGGQKKREKKEKAEAAEDPLKVLERERDDYKDKFLRTYADLENFRKRVVRDKEELLKFGNETLLKEILEIKDDLERALAHQETSDIATFKEGLALIGRDLDKILTKYDVQEIEAVGKKFDPQEHEALAQEESDKEPGTVLSQFQKGYLFHGRLLRPARVVVAKSPSQERPSTPSEKKES